MLVEGIRFNNLEGLGNLVTKTFSSFSLLQYFVSSEFCLKIREADELDPD